MQILITGGCGYIGSHVAWALQEASSQYDVHLLDNLCNVDKILPSRPGFPDAKFHNIDLCDASALRELLATHRFDAVVHCAAYKSVSQSLRDPLEYYRNNVGGLVTLLQCMASAGCFSLVFSSSATVYGDAPSPLQEDTPPGTLTNPYSQTKGMGERILCDTAASDDRWRISALRYFNPLGAHPSGLLCDRPRGKPSNLMPSLLDAVTTNTPFTIFGNNYDTPDGTCLRDYIHVVDLADAHEAALRRVIDGIEGRGVETFNLGTGVPHSVLEVVRAMEAAASRSIALKMGARRPGDCAAVWAKVDRARRVLGWSARRSLAEMCTDALCAWDRERAERRRETDLNNM